MNAHEVVRRLRALQAEEDRNLSVSQDTFGNYQEYLNEDVHDDEHPVLTAAIEDDPLNLKSMTNFTLPEFNVLWSQVEPVVLPVWNLGRGRRHRTTAIDAFLMVLTVLKHYDAWHKHAADFKMKTPTFEKMVNRMITLVEPVLSEKFIKTITMSDARRTDKTFRYYKYALYATDVKFQPANRPTGRFMEQKHYFSGKHKLYGYKTEYSVAMPGVAVNMTKHYPGSVSDLRICEENLSTHKDMLAKTQVDESLEDYGEGAITYPGYWAMLVDKGYQGLQDSIRTIQPTRQPRGGEYTPEQLVRNERVSSDRVLVENYFGRMCSLWNVMHKTYVWNEDRYDMLSRLCCALTNFSVSLMPLRAADDQHYKRTMCRYVSMAQTLTLKRKNEVAVARARSIQRTGFQSPTPSTTSSTSQSSTGQSSTYQAAVGLKEDSCEY
jgi:hypothetical protein